MFTKHTIHIFTRILIGTLGLVVLLGFVYQPRAAGMQIPGPSGMADASLTDVQQAVYLPTMMKYFPTRNFFGVESNPTLSLGSSVYTNTVNLPVDWVRLNRRISWSRLQPNEGDPISWGQMGVVDQEFRNLKAAGITPVVIIGDYPRWATDNTVRGDGLPTSCGKLLDNKVDDFAAFVTQVVNRYKAPEFGVHNWELGNEPDVDPNLVTPDSVFGCWGDIKDQYYGGEAYGRMIITVGSAIKAADPSAKVWMGGLLLDTPLTTDPTRGHPEKFLEGVLRVGAGPYFDILPYHWYPAYGSVRDRKYDYDLYNNNWVAWGGGTVGKVRYLRQIMQAYGVSKPIFLNETSFICINCSNPSAAFFNLQADYLVRSLFRAYNEGVMGFTWYTVNGSGWRWGGLTDANQVPRPAYIAFQQMVSQLQKGHLIGPVTYYGDGIEAYSFDRGPTKLDVLWAIEDQTYTVSIPASDWIGAYDRSGAAITPTVSGSNMQIQVGYDPVYLVRKP